MFVDPDALATDQRFPDEGHAGAAALVLLDALLATPAGLTVEQLRAEAETVLRRAPQWAKRYRTDDGAERLAADATAVLLGFGLVRDVAGTVVARPAAARYAVGPVTTRERPR